MWPLTNPNECRRLERAFSNRGIDYSRPAFHDSPEFLREERSQPRFLEAYARFVEARAYEEGYLADASRKVEVAAEVVRAAIAADGRLGACVDASGMLARMLDRLGVWNPVAKSTLTITFDPNTGHATQYFWVLDSDKFVASHAIVVAPPFCVRHHGQAPADPAVRMQ